jgi:hypothetical protein
VHAHASQRTPQAEDEARAAISTDDDNVCLVRSARAVAGVTMRDTALCQQPEIAIGDGAREEEQNGGDRPGGYP